MSLSGYASGLNWGKNNFILIRYKFFGQENLHHNICYLMLLRNYSTESVNTALTVNEKTFWKWC